MTTKRGPRLRRWRPPDPDRYGMEPTPMQLAALRTAAQVPKIWMAAEPLGISRNMLRHHLRSLYVRLGVESSLQAAWILWVVKR